MRISRTNRPQIFITMGDPAGIGPEVITKTLASLKTKRLASFVIIGDRDIFNKAGGSLLKEKHIHIVDPGPVLKNVKPGIPTDSSSRKALRCLDKAIDLIRSDKSARPKALVTAPLSKERIAHIYPGFIGHTEYLQKKCSTRHVTMVFVGKKLCVVPVTRHIPLRKVADTLSIDLIMNTLIDVMKNRALICGRKDARIGMCGLNPHCGEGGTIGKEEMDIIIPSIKRAKTIYSNIEGPIPADVIFYKAFKKEIDIVVSMYHDQGLASFKMLYFDSGVNMTLGLPFIRTSPDHGTAFDIAGRGVASSGSMEEAIKLAARGAMID